MTVKMTTGNDRSLIHYLCVLPEIRRQNVGTTMLKMIMSQDEYENRKIMAMTSLPASYRGVISYKTMGNFF